LPGGCVIDRIDQAVVRGLSSLRPALEERFSARARPWVRRSRCAAFRSTVIGVRIDKHPIGIDKAAPSAFPSSHWNGQHQVVYRLNRLNHIYGGVHLIALRAGTIFQIAGSALHASAMKGKRADSCIPGRRAVRPRGTHLFQHRRPPR